MVTKALPHIQSLSGGAERHHFADIAGRRMVRALPRPSGGHAVGFVDAEFPVGAGSVSAAIDPAAGVFPSHALVRLYYPAAASVPPAAAAPWLPGPEYRTCYGNFLGAPRLLSSFAAYLLMTGARVWAWPRPPPAGGPAPLVVFSHGLSGIRTTYSTLCAALASHGYVVAALEHRDGTCGVTVLGRGAGGPAEVPYVHPPEDEGQAAVFRTAQLARRAREVSALIDYLSACGAVDSSGAASAYSGSVNHNGDSNPSQDMANGADGGTESEVSRSDGGEPSAQTGEADGRNQIADTSDTDYSLLRAVCSQMSRNGDGSLVVGIMGHSFGGATAIVASEVDARLACRMLLDPWMLYVPRATAALSPHAHNHAPRDLPTAVADTEYFEWPENVAAVRDLLAPLADGRRDVIAGAQHMDQSDVAAVVPTWALRIVGKSAKQAAPVRVLEQTAEIALAFFKRVLPATTNTE